MAQQNTKVRSHLKTHEGAPARMINPEQQLTRCVLACMLWESSFYESGEDIADRIKALVHANRPDFVATLAIKARSEMKLRHVPLLLVRELARHKDRDKMAHSVAFVLDAVIQRADELTEFLAMYWRDGREKLSAQVKKGLALAFTKFSAYDLAKYNRDNAVKLRDVLFLSHAKPINAEQAELWKKLVDNALPVPDTWEVALSAGGDKKEIWTRLLKEKRLGALALLRNLRNMDEAGVDPNSVRDALLAIKTDRVLPFRFIAASRFAPALEPELETGMMKCLANQEKITGRTVLLIDVSGSMDGTVSDKSDITRIEAGCGLAILLREICSEVNIYTFSSKVAIIPPRHGFALKDAVINSQPHSNTLLGEAINLINGREKYERIIVISDEQTADRVPNPTGRGYMLNVASYQNGVGYGPWVNITGFSESIVDYIRESEKVSLG